MISIKEFNVYQQMCIKADEIQAVKSRIGWFDQTDRVLNKQTGVELLGLQLIQNKYSVNTAWIPTQSQVTTMINQLQSDITLIIEDFKDWYQEDTEFYAQVPYLTFEMLFLMYYMERYNRKFWCWGCGYWKGIAEKHYEIIERRAIIKSQIIIENTIEDDVKED